jgi:hypothetical protein
MNGDGQEVVISCLAFTWQNQETLKLVVFTKYKIAVLPLQLTCGGVGGGVMGVMLQTAFRTVCDDASFKSYN